MSTALTPLLEPKLLTQSFDPAASHAAFSTSDSISDFSRSLFGEAGGYFVDVQEDTRLKDRLAVLKSSLNAGAHDSFQLESKSRDKLGINHLKYQRLYDGVAVEGDVFTVHAKGGEISLISGGGLTDFGGATFKQRLTEDEAFSSALAHVGASKYMWQSTPTGPVSQAVADLYQRPEGELVVVANNRNRQRLAYKFDVHAVEPFSRDYVYVDARTGGVIKTISRIQNADVAATGTSLYNGIVSFTADDNTTEFRLRQVTDGVETYTLNNGTDYAAATDITSATSDFSAPGVQTGVQAHFGAEKTLQYFFDIHGRDSFDDLGTTLTSYVSFGTNFVNAFWNGSFMTYGDGDGVQYGPLVSLDIVGHEIAHGVTEFTAGLIYQDESGALNESFSDIFGETVENFGSGSNDWQLGTDIGIGGSGAIRSMDNPNAFGDPDTYLGDFWKTGPADNGGVHSNSGVQNKWFYILAEGEAGVNDNGDAYDVAGIGLAAAEAIAYRNLSTYLNPGSGYLEAAAGAVQSAIDLYGASSDERVSTQNAWAAVGIGNPIFLDLLVNHQYDPSAVAYSFDDISSTGNQVLLGADNTTLQINDAALGDFQFDFYGERYSDLHVSSNGLITFGGGNASAANSNLTASPALATIAPFWDDLITSGGIFWEVRGTGDDEQLVIQWNDVSRKSAPGAGDFQAVLGKNDDIQFNYKDLDFGDSLYNNGASATVGLKAAGDQSSDQNRVLVSLNDGSSPLVSSNSSILFEYNGAYVDGTSGDDNAIFEEGDLVHRLTVGNRSGTVNALAVDDLTFYGMGGTDSLSIIAGSNDDVFVLKDDVGTLTSDKLMFVGDSFESISADGGTGYDQANLYDSVGDNEFHGSPANATLTGDGVDFSAANMEKVRAFGSDGNDTAYLSDSLSNDRFIGKQNVSILVGAQFHNEVRGFDSVDASASGGFDRAIFYDSAGDDRFVGGTSFSKLTGDGFQYTAHAFDRVYAYASTGKDFSFLYDSVGSDRLIARKTHSILYGSNFYNQSRGFDNTYAYASTGNDVALMYDTAGNDVFTGRHNFARLTGAGYLLQANTFDKVWAYASTGVDLAYLSDHTTNDVFFGHRRYSRLFGGGFFNQANNFDRVFATASVGNDRAFVFGSSASDTLFGDKNVGILFGVDFYNHYRNFDFVSAHGLAGRDVSRTSKNLHYKLKSYVFA